MSILDELEALKIKVPTNIKKALRERSKVLRAKREVLMEQIRLFVRQHKKAGKWDSSKNVSIFIGGMKRLSILEQKIRRVSRAPIPEFDPYD